jgi:hypothetical protein
MNYSEVMELLTDEILELYEKKNSDYGNSFYKQLDEDGLLVSKIRLQDKLSRFSSIIKKDTIEVEDEKLRDTLIDLATYSIMTVAWMDNK